MVDRYRMFKGFKIYRWKIDIGQLKYRKEIIGRQIKGKGKIIRLKIVI